ncbi:GNAT family N-acetyltransferase [Kitasatospora sp. NPDC096147]|uniref:GNAT family N-acetyltransferase n=1 Tax=Kitasatospora sp. NPDC096147 TaxID=3364093 RepID=UPI003823A44B
MVTVELRVRPAVDDAELSTLHRQAFDPGGSGGPVAVTPWRSRLERHSISWTGAYHEGALIGFVHAVWDGGVHAFLLDTVVHPDHQRGGIGRELVESVVEEAFRAGCEWVHADYTPEHAAFYQDACGFRPTAAGLRAARRAPC